MSRKWVDLYLKNCGQIAGSDFFIFLINLFVEIKWSGIFAPAYAISNRFGG
jgi:hypothetical protein